MPQNSPSTPTPEPDPKDAGASSTESQESRDSLIASMREENRKADEWFREQFKGKFKTVQ